LGGMSRLGFIIYSNQPHEVHAYLLHREQNTPAEVDFEKMKQDPTYKPSCLPSLCM
jgi:hypothetical protein